MIVEYVLLATMLISAFCGWWIGFHEAKNEDKMEVASANLELIQMKYDIARLMNQKHNTAKP